MKNYFLLIPLLMCIWVLSIVIAHFYTSTHYEKQFNQLALENIEEITNINDIIINIPAISQKRIEENTSHLLIAAVAAKPIDFIMEKELIGSLYNHLSDINELIKTNYKEHGIYSYLDKQHFQFIQDYLKELNNLFANNLTTELKTNKKMNQEKVIKLYETVLDYHQQYVK